MHEVVLTVDLARLASEEVVRAQGGAQGAAGIARRRLHPYPTESAVAEHLAVGNAIDDYCTGLQMTNKAFEVREVELERTVGLEIDQAIQDEFGIARLAVRRQAHDLVLAGIDFEAGVMGEGRSPLRSDFRKSFSRSHTGMAIENDRKPRGANARYVSRRRSNLRNGLSFGPRVGRFAWRPALAR